MVRAEWKCPVTTTPVQSLSLLQLTWLLSARGEVEDEVLKLWKQVEDLTLKCCFGLHKFVPAQRILLIFTVLFDDRQAIYSTELLTTFYI